MPHEAVGIGYESALDLIEADRVPLDPESVPLEGKSERNEGEGVPLEEESEQNEGESSRGDLDSERDEEYYRRHEMI